MSDLLDTLEALDLLFGFWLFLEPRRLPIRTADASLAFVHPEDC